MPDYSEFIACVQIDSYVLAFKQGESERIYKSLMRINKGNNGVNDHV